MKVKQISSMLNQVFGEILGDTGLITEDMSNLVSAGQIITSSTQFGDNFENYAGKIVDKVGRICRQSVQSKRPRYLERLLGVWFST